MREPATPVPVEDGVPVMLDDEPIEIDDTATLAASMEAFNAGQLGAEDFPEPPRRKPEDYGPDEAVPVFPVELPAELDSDAPEVEVIMNRDEAERFLDQLVGNRSWRHWPRMPWHYGNGRRWYSPYELTKWVGGRS
jgi:hypothetical protein